MASARVLGSASQRAGVGSSVRATGHHPPLTGTTASAELAGQWTDRGARGVALRATVAAPTMRIPPRNEEAVHVAGPSSVGSGRVGRIVDRAGIVGERRGPMCACGLGMLTKHILGWCLASTMLLVGCASTEDGSNTTDTGASADTEIRAGAGRLEYVCALRGGKIVEVHPSFGELHRLDLNAHTWAMSDGLNIITSRDGKVAVNDGETRETIATITPTDGMLTYKEGNVTGTCSKFELQKLPFTNAPFALDDELEYECRVSHGPTLVIMPRSGEIEEISPDKGEWNSFDNMTFTLRSVETFPPTNEITATYSDDGSLVGTITEDDRGATWTADGRSTPCEKRSRVKK